MGVPTQIDERPPSLCTRWVDRKRPASPPRRIKSPKAGSITGLFHALISAIVPPNHVSQRRLITLNWIFPCSRNRPITAQIIRMNVHQRPFRRSGLSNQAVCTRHRSSAPLSEGRESNPTRGSGIGPHPRAISSDLSREGRPILARIS
jgi:hypothetical protein